MSYSDFRFDSHHPVSDDSTDTVTDNKFTDLQLDPLNTYDPLNTDIVITNSLSPTITIPLTVSPPILNLSPKMTSFNTTTHSTSKIDNNYAKTTANVLKISDILQGPQDVSQKKVICENMACGNYVFDIGFFIKTQHSQDDNQLVITIEHKSINKAKRGTKRKRDMNLSGNSFKKRRLNNSQSQSYSNGSARNGHHLHDGQGEEGESDRLRAKFTIYIAGPNYDASRDLNSSSKYSKST